MTLELRALEPTEDAVIRFEGYAAIFNERSQVLCNPFTGRRFVEVIKPGAFSETIVEDDIRSLYNHDPNFVLGRNKANTLHLSEDERGLFYTVEAPDVQWARDLHKSVKRGDVNQCSFAFAVIEDEWQTVDEVEERTLIKVKLFDVSIVTYPAYHGSEVSARSASEVLDEHLNRKPKSNPNSLLRQKLDLKEREVRL